MLQPRFFTQDLVFLIKEKWASATLGNEFYNTPN